MQVGHSMCEVGSFVAEDIEARNGDLNSSQETDGDDAKISHQELRVFSPNPNSSNVDQISGNRLHRKFYHCAGFPLWRARTTEELSKGGTSSATSRPLYGVLVCLRPVTFPEFRPSECTPLQLLCMTVAERFVEIRKKAQMIGESFVRRTTEQAKTSGKAGIELETKQACCAKDDGDVSRFTSELRCLYMEAVLY
jgi:hypothetical protein